MQIYIINLANNFMGDGLVIISMLSIISGILVIVSKNPVKSVLFLIGLFITIALCLFRLNISFIALAYLLVYVGAVSILFLFILMLINVRVSELTADNSNSIPLSIFIIGVFSLIIPNKSLLAAKNESLALPINMDLYNSSNKSDLTNLFFVKDLDEKVFLVFSCTWDNILGEVSHITSLGNILYTSHSISIIIVGLILLLSMIGAISVTAISHNDSGRS